MAMAAYFRSLFVEIVREHTWSCWRGVVVDTAAVSQSGFVVVRH